MTDERIRISGDMSSSERERASAITVKAVDAGPPARREGLEDKMRRLERRANVLRSRLVRTIEVLDGRRHQVAVVGQRAKKAASSLGLGLLGAALVVGAGIWIVGRAIVARRHRALPYRLSSAARALRPAATPSLGKRLIERVALTVVSILASEIAKRGSKNVLDGRSFSSGRRYAAGLE